MFILSDYKEMKESTTAIQKHWELPNNVVSEFLLKQALWTIPVLVAQTQLTKITVIYLFVLEIV